MFADIGLARQTFGPACFIDTKLTADGPARADSARPAPCTDHNYNVKNVFYVFILNKKRVNI